MADVLDDCCRLVQHTVLVRLRALHPLLGVAEERGSKGWVLGTPSEARRLLLLLLRLATLPSIRRRVPLVDAQVQSDGSCLGTPVFVSGWAPPRHGAEHVTALGNCRDYIVWLLQALGEAMGRESIHGKNKGPLSFCPRHKHTRLPPPPPSLPPLPPPPPLRS